MRKIAGIVAAAALVVSSLFTPGTFAWFTDLQASQTVFEVGSIKYVLNDAIQTPDRIVVPGEPLFTGEGALYMTNLSNIDTNLRIRLVVGYTGAEGAGVLSDTVYGPGLTYDGEHPITDLLTITLADGWEYDSGTQCFYYASGGLPTTIPAAGQEDGNIEVFSALSLGGEGVTPSHSGALFNIKFIFQAKQADYAEWSDIGMAHIDLLS